MSESNKTADLFSSGPVKWSEIRKNFKGVEEGAISAKDLYRETKVDVYDAIVPDADENSNIPAIDSDEELRMGDFRNTIKEVIVEQSSRNKNYNASGSSYWGSNLDKNIKKKLIVKGQVYSQDSNQAAMVWNDSANNVDIEVTGTVIGTGGINGTAPSSQTFGTIDGQDGGPAFQISVPSDDLIHLKVGGQSGAILGGGGGGGSGLGGYPGEDGDPGADGADGADGANGPVNTSAGSGGSGSGGIGGAGGLGGRGGSRGDGYEPGSETVTDGGDGGDGGDGSPGGTGGTGGSGGNVGDDGADGADGADGSDGYCQGVTDYDSTQRCGGDAPKCPGGWADRGQQRDRQRCGWLNRNYYRVRRCEKIQQVSVRGGSGGRGGQGGSGGSGGQGGSGGSGATGGYGGAGGSGGRGGSGGDGGKGKGYKQSGYGSQTNNAKQLGTEGTAGVQGRTGGDARVGRDGSAGYTGGRGERGYYLLRGEPGEPAESCPSGLSNNQAESGQRGDSGKIGGQGKQGGTGQKGGDSNAGQRGEDGTPGNPGQDGGVGGDYGQDGEDSYGSGGLGGNAIVSDGGYYITDNTVAGEVKILGETENAGSNPRTSSEGSIFTTSILNTTADLTASATSFGQGESINFTFTVNDFDGSQLYFSISGFQLGPNDLENQSSTNDYKTGVVNVGSTGGSFTIQAQEDANNVNDVEKELLVALRLDGTDGEILDFMYITLVKTS